jgi:hypothetical protein
VTGSQFASDVGQGMGRPDSSRGTSSSFGQKPPLLRRRRLRLLAIRGRSHRGEAAAGGGQKSPGVPARRAHFLHSMLIVEELRYITSGDRHQITPIQKLLDGNDGGGDQIKPAKEGKERKTASFM